MGTFANGEDPDEMPHQAAFHLGLHFCGCRNNLQDLNYTIIWEFHYAAP